MTQRLSIRLLTLGIAIGTALLLLAAARASSVAHSRTHAAGALVTLRTTALGRILADARGHTLYLFEKDPNGVSMCSGACRTYWPPLASDGPPRAGKGVHQSLLRLVRSRNGTRQVTYAGHPLYTFVGDKRARQTSGQGLDDFGAEWYVLAPSGHKVER